MVVERKIKAAAKDVKKQILSKPLDSEQNWILASKSAKRANRPRRDFWNNKSS